jgi:hypothetical protein
MQGHEPLLRMRMAGNAPSYVEVYTEVLPWTVAQPWADWQRWNPLMPAVYVAPDDDLEALDLRWCVALRVRVFGRDAERVQAVADALKNAGADRILTTTFEPLCTSYWSPEANKRRTDALWVREAVCNS